MNYLRVVSILTVEPVVVVALKILFRSSNRIAVMLVLCATTSLCFVPSISAQQTYAQYPLHAAQPATRPTTPSQFGPNSAGWIAANRPASKSAIVGNQPSSGVIAASSFADRRAAFQNQFEEASRRVASAMAANLKGTPPTDVDPAAVNDSANAPDQLHMEFPMSNSTTASGAENAPSDTAVITPLPSLKDVTDRFPRVAALTVAPETQLRSGVHNDTTISSVPPLPSFVAPTNAAGSNPNWWNFLVQQPLHPTNKTQPVDSNWLVYMALENSPRIQALSRDPLIRDFEVVEADSNFDPVSFLQTQFADRSDPLGGSLDATRDGLNTIENHQWTAEGGLRKRARTGATYELSQRLGFQNSNVAVFDPNNQGTAQLALNVTQPLARGRGRYINQSQLLIAQSRGGAAWETFAAELQEEIESVVSAYWRLYFDRSVFLQKKRSVQRVAEILEILEGRADLDSLPSQITRARSSLQSRKTDLANAFRDVRDSETELRRLIADRNWIANQDIELLPSEAPVSSTLDVSLEHVVTTSLNHRPEIRETMQRAKLAGIERDISVNDLLPELSLLLGTYVSTLQDDGRFGRAFVDQFGETKPGYSVGLEFELPIRNRAARSRLIQRKLQLAKIKNQVDETMQNIIAESQIALRRVNSAAETLQAAYLAIEATNSDVAQNIRNWESFSLVEGDFSEGQTPTTVLDQLLDSQERLAAAELVAAQSQLELKVAEVALQRSMGTLLIQKQIDPKRAFEAGGLPKVKY